MVGPRRVREQQGCGQIGARHWEILCLPASLIRLAGLALAGRSPGQSLINKSSEIPLPRPRTVSPRASIAALTDNNPTHYPSRPPYKGRAIQTAYPKVSKKASTNINKEISYKIKGMSSDISVVHFY